MGKDTPVRQNRTLIAVLNKVPRILNPVLRRVPGRVWCRLGIHRPYPYAGHGVCGSCCFYCGKMIEGRL